MILSNIERREKLLSNTGYVSKAPAHLVEEEKRKLEEEKTKLSIIEEKLSI
jgi:valyl-tRNA synthetase